MHHGLSINFEITLPTNRRIRARPGCSYRVDLQGCKECKYCLEQYLPAIAADLRPLSHPICTSNKSEAFLEQFNC